MDLEAFTCEVAGKRSYGPLELDTDRCGESVSSFVGIFGDSLIRAKWLEEHGCPMTEEIAGVNRRSLDALFSQSALESPACTALFTSGRYWSHRELDTEVGKIERTLR